MKEGTTGLRLRIFVHEEMRYDDQPLYAALVQLAKREGVAGATVFRGIEGYGQHRHLHTSRLVDVSDDLPMIIEFIDAEETIHRFLALLDGVIAHGTATVSPVGIVKYRAAGRGAAS